MLVCTHANTQMHILPRPSNVKLEEEKSSFLNHMQLKRVHPNENAVCDVQLALTSLTRGIRTVAYQLLNILTELETAETSTDGRILASIRDGDAGTDLLRRLLIDFMDTGVVGQQDSSTQSDFEDQSDDLVSVN